MKKARQTTYTSIVFDHLLRVEDFQTLKQVCEATGVDNAHACTALHNLRNVGAVQSLTSDGALWWYATPESDTRTRVMQERAIETTPRRPKKKKAQPQK